MQKAEQQDIAQPLESLNNPMEFPWVPSWLMVSNIHQNQGEFLTGKLFFFLAGLVFTFKLVKLCQANTPFKCLEFPSRGQTTRKPPPCHSPVLGRSAFENTAGQIEIFFLWFILRKKCRIPALSYIHSCSSIMIRWNRVYDPGPCSLRVAVAMSEVLTEASVVEDRWQGHSGERPSRWSCIREYVSGLI